MKIVRELRRGADIDFADAGTFPVRQAHVRLGLLVVRWALISAGVV